MTAGAHDAGGGFGRSAGTNAARGVMVIVAAVAVGLLLMFQGLADSDSETDAAAGDPSAEATDGATTETTVATGEVTTTTAAVAETTTTLAAPRDPSTVKVLVLNGTDPVVAGKAGAGTDVLKASNYVTLSPKNADVPGASAIYYTEGFQAEAVAVAAAYGVDPAAVVQPLDPAALPVADTQGANVIVRIGSDGVIQV